MAKADLALRLGCIEAATSLVTAKMERGTVQGMDETTEVIKKAEIFLAWINNETDNQ